MHCNSYIVSCLILGLFLAATLDCALAVEKDKALTPCNVRIAPKAPDYSIQQHGDIQLPDANDEDAIALSRWEPYGTGFPITCTVTNTAKNSITLSKWSGSRYENWQSNTERVVVLKWPVRRNAVVQINLKPGESFSETIFVRVCDAKVNEKLRCRLGFVPATDGPRDFMPNWSNSIELKIVK